MEKVKRKHWNLYYIFLCDKRAHPPPADKIKAMRRLIFGKKKE